MNTNISLVKICGIQAVKAPGYSNEEVTRYTKGNQGGKYRNVKEKLSYKNVIYRFLCVVKYLLSVFKSLNLYLGRLCQC